MTGVVRVDTGGLRGAAPRFEAVADALERVRVELAGALDAEGTAWGSDETGSAFGLAYVPGSDAAVDGLRRVTEALRAVAATATGTAVAFDAADHGFAGRLGGPS
ncbi:WXG100 family type VII secretion target [Rhodococcus kronopolitis]|uniref:WXG100 family type VII secretion target n=1 Tax=Rhodococcus kronopolitis TaxID=1460226 RepID=A0ABV9FY22_9NOCA